MKITIEDVTPEQLAKIAEVLTGVKGSASIKAATAAAKTKETTTTEAPTLESLKELVTQKVQISKKSKEVRALFDRYEVKGISEVDPERYAEIEKDLKAIK